MITELTTFFNEQSIPEPEQREKTFLEITQQPHYENVLSNIYAFFFSVNEEHGFDDLFLSTLSIIIAEKMKGKDFSQLDNPEVATEWLTKKGGRIDLLIYSKQGAIIIENKVYHTLNNDLDDYWTSVSAIDDQKVGILLSLYPIDKSQYVGCEHAKHYFNLTHLALMDRIMAQLDAYRESASPKFLVFLKDFYQNIQNLSQPSMQPSDLQFYLKHRTPIHHAASLKAKFRDYVKREAAKVNQRLNKELDLVNKYHKERLVYYASKVNEHLMLTLIFENLFEGKNEIHLFVELKDSAKTVIQENPDLYQGDVANDRYKQRQFATTKGYWAHFAHEALVLSDEDLSNLSEAIATRINNSPLLAIFNALEQALNAKAG